ncbi:MAG: hypothetical protein EBR82_10085 [Caulobacteraceae bacterium]|nr:hypothetical protein [Caulobacteraceae bacterium]
MINFVKNKIEKLLVENTKLYLIERVDRRCATQVTVSIFGFMVHWLCGDDDYGVERIKGKDVYLHALGVKGCICPNCQFMRKNKIARKL